MRSTFASRRPKAKIIGRNDEDDEQDEDQPGVVKGTTSKSSEQSKNGSSFRPKAKKRSTLRLSFGPDDTSTTAEGATEVFTPKKSALSRKAIEKNATRKSGLSASVTGTEQLNPTPSVERPSYSKEYLEELRSNTPTIPISQHEDLRDVDMVVVDPVDPVESGTLTKFGDSSMSETVIPDEGLVRIMKARRAEKAARAKTGDYISLDADSGDGDGGEILLKGKKKKESRLQRADDMFDDEEIEKYVEDGRVVIGSKSTQREHDRKRRQGIREAINEAEGVHDSNDMDVDSDVSRDSLVEEWERDQIKKGAFSTNTSSGGIARDLEMLSKQPPHVTPLPNLEDALRGLQDTLNAMEHRKAQTARQMEALQQEKEEIAQREVMVQERLQKASEEYEKLKGSLEIGGGGPEGVVNRGLESFGNTPIRAAEEI